MKYPKVFYCSNCEHSLIGELCFLNEYQEDIKVSFLIFEKTGFCKCQCPTFKRLTAAAFQGVARKVGRART